MNQSVRRPVLSPAERTAGPRVRQVPAGDDRQRLVCPDCGHIHYENPKIVVGVVAATPDDRLLLARRAIPPRVGYWTIPAGYLELNESPTDGVRREAYEEAGAAVTLDQLLAIYAIERIHQVQLIYRGWLAAEPALEAGPESAELGLFPRTAIPWDDLAFPTVRWALTHSAAVRDRATFAPFHNPNEADPNLPPEERG